MSDRISVSIAVDGVPTPSDTRVTSAAAEVLVLSTTLTSPRAPFTLHSTYVGARGEQTSATHLLLAPNIEDALTDERHAPLAMPVTEGDRWACLYDHLQRLMIALQSAGHEAAIDVDDRALQIVDT